MKLKGFVETSFVDWDGQVCSVVFTGGCNFQCGFCFNGALVLEPDTVVDVPEDVVFAFIEKHNDFIDGVCITGGEPTLSSGLVDFCQKLKGKDFLVKLDTNGTNPEVLKTLIDSKLVDFVAMDIKGPWENYGDFIGVPFNAEQLKESVKLIMDSGIDYEFRTTIVPELHTLEVFEKLVAQVSGAKKFCIQKFRSGMCLDPKFNEKKPQTDDEMKPFVEIAEKHATVVKMRGK